jgi:CRP/FNR family transcriptional regulator, anaerobic regulatory protein
VAAYLLDLPTTRSTSGHAVVGLPLAKKDIAVHLGTSPETLSRRLAQFEREGLVRLDGTRIGILDPAGLDARARQA